MEHVSPPPSSSPPQLLFIQVLESGTGGSSSFGYRRGDLTSPGSGSNPPWHFRSITTWVISLQYILFFQPKMHFFFFWSAKNKPIQQTKELKDISATTQAHAQLVYQMPKVVNFGSDTNCTTLSIFQGIVSLLILVLWTS